MPHDAFARVARIARVLPGVTESTSYGTPALKVSGKLLVRLKEDGETLALKCGSLDEKEFLMAQRPEIYFETDHYKGWASVLCRYTRLTDAELLEMLEQAWRREAGKKLLAAYAGAACR